MATQERQTRKPITCISPETQVGGTEHLLQTAKEFSIRHSLKLPPKLSRQPDRLHLHHKEMDQQLQICRSTLGAINCAIWSLMGSRMRLCKDKMADEAAQTKRTQERLSLPQAAAPVFEDYSKKNQPCIRALARESDAAIR